MDSNLSWADMLNNVVNQAAAVKLAQVAIPKTPVTLTAAGQTITEGQPAPMAAAGVPVLWILAGVAVLAGIVLAMR
jgi:hypothetical protein